MRGGGWTGGARFPMMVGGQIIRFVEFCGWVFGGMAAVSFVMWVYVHV